MAVDPAMARTKTQPQQGSSSHSSSPRANGRDWKDLYYGKEDIVVIRGLREWRRAQGRWPRTKAGGLEGFFYDWLKPASRGKSRRGKNAPERLELLNRELVTDYPNWREEVVQRQSYAVVDQALQSLAEHASGDAIDLERREKFDRQRVRICLCSPTPHICLPLSLPPPKSTAQAAQRAHRQHRHHDDLALQRELSSGVCVVRRAL